MGKLLLATVFIVGMSVGAFIESSLFITSSEKTIKNFENPTCITKTIGKEEITKCFEIREVADE